MEITKAVMTTDGPALRLSVPIAKVDTENRVVSGFATLDNVDQHGDVVTAEASAKAFARFRGNLREMHAPIAVGKVLNFDEVEFYDADNDTIYRGVFVDAFVSRGAEDTWQKVLDGTLSGFSIGGKVLADETKMVKSGDKEALVRHITDYELLELSLVDNPANQYANVLSITKSADGSTLVKGIAVDVNLENILYCANDKIAVTSDKESADCAGCGNKMVNIGWVESQASDKVDKIRTAVAKQQNMVIDTTTVKKGTITSTGLATFPGFITPATYNTSSTNGTGYTINITLPYATDNTAEQVQKNSTNTLEGGVDTQMSDEKKAEEVAEQAKEARDEAVKPAEVESPKAEEVEEVAPTEEAPAAEENATAAEVEEVEAEEVDIKKMFSTFAAEIKDAVTTSSTETAEVVKSVKAEVTAKVDALEAKVSELETKFSEVQTEVAKRVDAVESDTAIKKSADLGGSTESKTTKNESIWGGRFLNANVSDITR